MSPRRWPVAGMLAAAVACSPTPDPGRGGTESQWPMEAPVAGGRWPSRELAWPGGQATAPSPHPVSWPATLAAPLTATGLELVGGAGERAVVVDGAGMLWVLGPWQVARVDPQTGAGSVWDASADAAFGAVESIAPSSTAGVWLVEADRVRLFDGERFVVVLPIPPEYRGGSGVVAMVERGAEVWIGTDAGVARWAEGEWAVLGLGQLRDVAVMAVDTEGAVWASGTLRTGGRARRGVAVFDGRSWVVPGHSSAPAARVEEIDVDPTGGVVVRVGTARSRLYRFESGEWTDLTEGPGAARPGALGPDGAVVAPDGRIWVVGDQGIASRGRLDAWWQAPTEPDQGDDPVGQVTGLAHAAGGLVASDARGLLRLEGGALVRLWTDPALPAGDVPGAGEMQPNLIAVSAHEAWVDYRPWEVWLPRMLRYTPQGWSTSEPPVTAYADGTLSGLPVLATDGALWQVTVEGLARFDGRRWSVVDPTLVGAGFGRAQLLGSSQIRSNGGLPGPDGSLWLSEPGWQHAVREIRPDGSRRRVGLPGAATPEDLRAVAGDGEGRFWALLAGVGAVPRVDDQWGDVVALPPGMAVALEAAVGGDGALWATLLPVRAGAEQVLARLDGGRWQVFDHAVVGLSAVPVGVCGVRGREYWGGGPIAIDQPVRVVCLAATGHTEEVVLPVPAETVAVARDGGVWLVGEQLARLPQRLGSRATCGDRSSLCE